MMTQRPTTGSLRSSGIFGFPHFFAAPQGAAYNVSYSFALACHEKSHAIACRINFCHFFGCLWSKIAWCTASTNAADLKAKKKVGEPEKPVEVVFVVEKDKAKMLPVKRGISDDNYVEITEGVQEGQEVVSGGYKAISRELEDGKPVTVGTAKTAPDEEKK